MKQMNDFINRVQIYSIEDLKKDYYRKTKGHWFDQSSMKFFNSRISSELFYSPNKEMIYFVSSEQFNRDHARLYSVRSYNVKNGNIDTVGEFQQYNTMAQAKRAAKNLAKNN